MRLHLLPLALSLFAIPCASRSPIYSISLLPKRAAPQPSPGVGASARTREGKALPYFKQPTSSAPQRYSLPPEKRAKAIAYSRIRYTLYFVGAAFSLGIYFFIWRARIAALFQSWARRISRRHIAQCLIFVPLFVVVVSLLEFPLDYYSGFALEHRFDLSTQGFASWLMDWSKGAVIDTVVGILVVWMLYLVIRRSPRRWWFYFWLATIPLVLAFILIQPVMIDPLFYQFQPLEKTQPALTARVEEMLHHAGLEIPASRIFEMDASRKTRILDAYVTGIGASKRVVLWDTTLRKLDEDETLLTLGHETGHYVLHHIPKEFALTELLLFVLLYIGFVWANRMVENTGRRTGIESMGDLASLPVLALVLAALWFLSAPIVNGISRRYEHQADQFGLEVAYGVVPDPNASEARSLQVLGEEDLADPDPNPFIRFWLYSHPPLDERIRFAVSYKPWAEGKPFELLRPQR